MGGAPEPEPSGHQPQSAVDHTVGTPLGTPPSVPHQRTGWSDVPPPPLKATASRALVERTSAPTSSQMEPQPPSSQISVRLPNWVHSSRTCASASASYCACVTLACPGSSVLGGCTLCPSALR